MTGKWRFIKYLFRFLFIVFISSCAKNADHNSTLPAVITLNALSITTTSAVTGGIVTNDGGSPISEKGICIGTHSAPTVSEKKMTTTNPSDTFSINITGLQPATTCYVRAYAINATGISYGNEITFQTLAESATYSDVATTMYVSGGYSNKLFSLNASDGSIKWTATLGGYVVSSPIYSNGMVYVGCMDDKLYAYDTLGTLKWTANTNGIYTECPVVSNGMVYFPDGNSINAFNAQSGALIWKFAGGGGNMVLKKNTIYTNRSNLYAIDANTGNKKWEHYTATSGQPLVCDDRVYVENAVMQNSLDVVSIATGQLLWNKPNFGVFSDLNSMNFANGNLYCVTAISANSATNKTNGLNVLDSATATRKFPTSEFQVDTKFSDNVFPLFADSLAFIPADYYIAVCNAFTGKMAYTIPDVGGNTASGITIVNNLVYYTERSDYQFGKGYYAGFLHAFDFKTRKMLWTKEFRDTDFLLAAPCVVTKSGKVYRGALVSE